MAEGSPAKVLEVLGRSGVRGEIIQVRCEVLDGPEAGKALVRNVKGPVKAGDILMLLETVMQARRIEKRPLIDKAGGGDSREPRRQ